MTRLVLGPFNRVEGDLEVTLEITDEKVSAARVNSPLYRGFERMLTGRSPQDALTITPRICGICSISQSVAAAQALASAMKITPPPQGQLISALLHAVENMADHLTHFTLFFMPDFTREHYADHSWHKHIQNRFSSINASAAHQALDARSNLLHIVGMLAGKWPHTLAIQPGGVTKAPGLSEKMRLGAIARSFRRYLEEVFFQAPLEQFIALQSQNEFLNWRHGDVGLFCDIAAGLDLASLGKGPMKYLSFGAYPLDTGHVFKRGIWDKTAQKLDTTTIREDLSYSWMLGESAHPSKGITQPDETMRETAYSWNKAPRLDGQVVEVGAIARQLIDGHPLAQSLVQGGGGVLARVGARLLELARTQLVIEDMIDRILPQSPFITHAAMPESGQGEGLVEAARGALGHWVTIRNGKIYNYQIIAPTSWNFSPKDDRGISGALEMALLGSYVGNRGDKTPINVQHIIRSFDPCMVCTVH